MGGRRRTGSKGITTLPSNVAPLMTTTELARHRLETIWNRRQIAEAFNLLARALEDVTPISPISANS